MRLWRASASDSSSAWSSSSPATCAAAWRVQPSTKTVAASSSDRSASSNTPTLQSPPAPVARAPQGALALGQVYRPGPQRVQRPGQPTQDRVGVQQPGAGGGQLD